MSGLRYDPAKGRYRDAGGKLLTNRQVRVIRDDLADTYADRFEALVEAYVDGRVQRPRFGTEFHALVLEATSAGYVLGRGGVAAMTDADYDVLATLTAKQEQFAAGFLTELDAAIEQAREVTMTDLADAIVAAGEYRTFIGLPISAIREGLSGTVRGILRALRPQLVARARNYAGTSVHAFEHGQAAATFAAHPPPAPAPGVPPPPMPGPDDLPGMPADGETPCHGNCRCWWSYERTDAGWECTWHTQADGKVCSGCKERGEQWAPYVLV